MRQETGADLAEEVRHVVEEDEDDKSCNHTVRNVV